MAKEPENNREVRPGEVRDPEVRNAVKKTRRSKMEDVDEFYVDPKDIPDGFTIEWKRYQTYGKVDERHLTNLEKDGWEFASPKDFPSLVGRHHKGAMIVRGNGQDLVLMIRPKELTEEARQEDYIKSRRQVQTKMEEIGLSKTGEAPRTDSAGRSLAKVKTSYERIPVGD